MTIYLRFLNIYKKHKNSLSMFNSPRLHHKLSQLDRCHVGARKLALFFQDFNSAFAYGSLSGTVILPRSLYCVSLLWGVFIFFAVRRTCTTLIVRVGLMCMFAGAQCASQQYVHVICIVRHTQVSGTRPYYSLLSTNYALISRDCLGSQKFNCREFQTLKTVFP